MKKILYSLSLLLLMPHALVVAKCGNPNQSCGVKCASLPILSVPFTINQPGHYLVPRSLTYAGAGSAITVAGIDNVTIEFCDGAQLTTTNPLAFGITITDADNVDVLKATLVGTLSDDTTSRGIYVDTSSNISIQHASITNYSTGILLVTSANIDIGNLVSDAANAILPITSHVRARSVNNFTLHDSQFRTTLASNIFAGGLLVQDTSVDDVPTGIPCTSVNFRNLECYNTDILAGDVDGFVAENINTVIQDADYIFSMFQLGTTATVDVVEPTPVNANNVILRNSSFTNRTANDSAIGVQVTQGTGIVIDGILVDINSAGVGDPDACQEDPVGFPASGAKLAIGNNANSGCTSQVVDCVVRNSSFVSVTPSGYGITILATDDLPNSGVIIDNCLVDNCIVDGILVRNSVSCAIQNSNVQRCGDDGSAIHLDTGAFSNAVLRNVVSNNDGNGITIEDGSILNHLQNNAVYDNDNVGINNLEGSTQIYYNTSCGNGTNCVGVFPSLNPGDPSVVGENICCEVIPG